jgi:hypothetical protein
MKLVPVALVCAFFILALPSLAMAANNTTTAQNLTPVSISQNATISVPTPATGLANRGTFENATVFASGGANVTDFGNTLGLNLGEAPWMDYRDIYLFYRLPPGYARVSFDYDLQAGEKSNVLLISFADDLPKTGDKRSVVPDTAVLGLGTWTNRNSEIRGMNDIGGLEAFPQGVHHVDVFPDNGMLYMNVDGNTTAYNYKSMGKYLLIHLMVGDEKSYLRGTLANLKYEGPPLDNGKPGDSGNTSGFPVPGVTLSGNDNGSAGGLPGASGDKEATPRPANDESKQAIGLNIWLALAAAAGFFIAWAIVYTKYLKR